MTGQQAEQVRNAAGRFVVYTKADLREIKARITELEGQIALLQAGPRARGPIYMRYRG